jgi:hypothetical protein
MVSPLSNSRQKVGINGRLVGENTLAAIGHNLWYAVEHNDRALFHRALGQLATIIGVGLVTGPVDEGTEE